MNCLNCNTPMASIDYCTNCGADMRILKRLERISNLNYNEGLDKANIRDLSGAIECLKRSLKFNKYNINARNLLGLVYFETGEVVAALSEWVISKNLQEEDNIADIYIKKLQSNPNKLNTINQTIRKYNQALLYCQENSDDMAIIQLKKLLSQNPKLIKGQQLLALLYIHNKEYEKARKILKKAAKIDTTNTITLRYIQEVDEATGTVTRLSNRKTRKRESKIAGVPSDSVRYLDGNELIIQPATFQESSIIATFLNIGLGLIVGAAVVWFLVLPATRQRFEEKANNQVVDFSNQISVQQNKIAALEEEVEKSADIQEAANEKEAQADAKMNSLEGLLKAVNTFYTEEDKNTAADLIQQIDPETLSEEGKSAYEAIRIQVNDTLFQRAFQDAETAYHTEKDYNKSAELYLKALEYKPEDKTSLLYLAHSYYNAGNYKDSNVRFNEYMSKYGGDYNQYLKDDTELDGTQDGGEASQGE
ncbi:MAG TPA: hypothetical protein IAC41_12270 [Candidatus Merdenecus merdavium]|nr:hypothetical protein [Candidatus Merdenecus merdavium]